MDERENMQKLIGFVGGEENIESFYHCITRLRFVICHKDQVKIEQIKSLKPVKAVKFQNNELQVVIGSDVSKYYQILLTLIEKKKESEKKKVKANWTVKSVINNLMDVLSGVFVPILPAITGAGMVKSLLAFLGAFNLINVTGDVYQVLNLVADSAFYFLPFMLAVTSARKFGVNEFLGLMVAGSIMYPLILNGAIEGAKDLIFLGARIPLVNYSSSVIPVVLGVYLLSTVYNFFDKFIPRSYSLLVTSTVSILIVIPLVLAFIAPLGYYAGNGLANFIHWIFAVSGPLAGLIIGATVPLIVMTGMHYAVNPIVLQNLTKMNYDIIAPLFFISNISQAGVALGVGVKTKDSEQKSLAYSTGVSAVFGITEPAMYGVNLYEKKPFYIALISSGIGGFIASFLGVKVFSFVMPGLTGLPAYIDHTANFYFIVLALLITFLCSFVGTILFWKSEVQNLKGTSKKELVKSELGTEDKVLNLNIIAPISGRYIDLSEVPDPIFSEKVMGDGFAIEPIGDTVYAPISGVVTVISETSHAIGIRGEDGMEILIHLGIDTVKLNGQGFDSFIKQGELVEQGQKIAEVNWSFIEKKHFSKITPVIFTNIPKIPEKILNKIIGSEIREKTSILN